MERGYCTKNRYENQSCLLSLISQVMNSKCVGQDHRVKGKDGDGHELGKANQV